VKLTKSHLRKIIKEELFKISLLSESNSGAGVAPGLADKFLRQNTIDLIEKVIEKIGPEVLPFLRGANELLIPELVNKIQRAGIKITAPGIISVLKDLHDAGALQAAWDRGGGEGAQAAGAVADVIAKRMKYA